MPTVGGKVLKADSIGTMFTIDLDWTMEQGTTYAGQLAEAGFGEDAAETMIKPRPTTRIKHRVVANSNSRIHPTPELPGRTRRLPLRTTPQALLTM